MFNYEVRFYTMVYILIVRRNLLSYGLFYCIVKDSYALKLSKSSALKFWMYAEWPRTSSSAMRT